MIKKLLMLNSASASKVWCEQKAAAKAAEHERRAREEAERLAKEEAERCEREEAEHWQREEGECQQREEIEQQKREEAECWQWESAERMQARVEILVGDWASESVVAAKGSRDKGKGKESGQTEVPAGPCSWCLRAQAECTFELAKVSKRGKKSCDRCTGLKEQCKLLGGSKEAKAGTKVGKRTPEDQTSLRASEKKKQARVKSPEVEASEGPSRVTGIEAGGSGIMQALYAIANAIDRHTLEMQEHRRVVKAQHKTQHRLSNHLWDLLQETEYRQLEPDEMEEDVSSEGDSDDVKGSDADGEWDLGKQDEDQVPVIPEL
ncbi:hypothetical protein PISMIDRAFT_10989 [Pisolithus microcarpus 441]|uniref:Zn(2)-C6 fungal-type domain-containing protein n=1 Tax=Pisolithus microcarpus 441 TaxID=765257 RepID=A0A0C9Z2U2_9AGAM|nr:hypothetical protein BKA83DRAFT_10989 [Pisolithus microcarpus]KIK23351.1 hypothetical protein PISMIDRAFT_10989 [Pisolithus microcarpus 441]